MNTGRSNSPREALMLWCQRVTSGYPGVSVLDFSKSWRDGLALLAIMHRNRSDLVEFYQSSKLKPIERFELAFRIAEKEFGVARLLDPEDVAIDNPDEKSLICYLSMLYDNLPTIPKINPYIYDMWRNYEDIAVDLLHWINFCKKQISPLNSNDVARQKFNKNELQKIYNDTIKKTGFFPLDESLSLENIEKLLDSICTKRLSYDSPNTNSSMNELKQVVYRINNNCQIVEDTLQDLEVKIQLDERHGVAIPNNTKLHTLLNVENNLQNIESDLLLLQQDNHPAFKSMQDRIKRIKHRLNDLTISNKSIIGFQSPRIMSPRMMSPIILSPISFSSSYQFSPTNKNSGTLGNVQACLEFVQNTQRKLDQFIYPDNAKSCENEIVKFTKLNSEIKNFYSRIEDCLSQQRNVQPTEMEGYERIISKLQVEYAKLRSTSDYCRANLDSLFSFLQSFYKLDKEMKSILATVTANDVSRWSPNFPEKALGRMELIKDDVTYVLDSGDSLLNDNHPSSASIQMAVEKVEDEWRHLLQLSKCVEIQADNIRKICKFDNEVEETKNWIKKEINLANNLSKKRDNISPDEIERILIALQEVKFLAEDRTDAINELSEISKTLISTKMRTTEAAANALVEPITNLDLKEGKLYRSEECRLMSIKNEGTWVVKNVRGLTVHAPSLCFNLMKFDPQTNDIINNLKDEMDILHKTLLDLEIDLRFQSIQSLMTIIKNSEKLKLMNSMQRSLIFDKLKANINTLLNIAPSFHQKNLQEMLTQCNHIYKTSSPYTSQQEVYRSKSNSPFTQELQRSKQISSLSQQFDQQQSGSVSSKTYFIGQDQANRPYDQQEVRSTNSYRRQTESRPYTKSPISPLNGVKDVKVVRNASESRPSSSGGVKDVKVTRSYGSPSVESRKSVSSNDGALTSADQEEHMHEHDVEESVQKLEDGEEKVVKQTIHEFHKKQTDDGLQSISVHEKKMSSLISSNTSAFSGNMALPISVKRAIQLDLFDPIKGDFTHPESKEIYNLKVAVDNNYLDVTDTVLMSNARALTMKEALYKNIISSHGGFYVNGKNLNFQELINQGFISYKKLDAETMDVNSKVVVKTAPVKKTFQELVINDVIDPDTKMRISASEAVKRGFIDQANLLYYAKDAKGNVIKMPIMNACELGLVFVEEAEKYVRQLNGPRYIQETKTFEVTGVLDPYKKKISLDEAVKLGYVDEKKGLYMNPLRSEVIKIGEAFEKGWVLAKEVDSNSVSTDLITANKVVSSRELACTVISVMHPGTGKSLDATEAIKLGILDVEKGMYCNLQSGDRISLANAIDQGLVIVAQGKPKKDEDAPREEKVLSLHIDDEMDSRDEMASEEIIEELHTFKITGVLNQEIDQIISFQDAIKFGFIDEHRGLYRDTSTNKWITLPDALQKGFVVGSTNLVDHQELFRSKIVANRDSKITAAYSHIIRSMIPIQQAIKMKMVADDLSWYYDASTGTKLTMDDAIDKKYIQLSEETSSKDEKKADVPLKGRIDWSAGKVFDANTGEEIDLNTALKYSLIEESVAAVLRMKNPSHHAPEIVDKINETKATQMHKMTFSISNVQDRLGKIIIQPDVIEEAESDDVILGGLSFYEAVQLGLFDVASGKYYDLSSGEYISFQSAINFGIIDPNLVAFINLNENVEITLKDALTKHYIDLSNGKINENLLKKNGVAVHQNFSVKSLSKPTLNLYDAIKCGLFNVQNGQFKNVHLNKYMTLEEAINSNYISGHGSVVFNPITGDNITLKEALEADVIDGFNGRFIDTTLEKNIDLNKAFRIGLLKNAFTFNSFLIFDKNRSEYVELDEAIRDDVIDLNIPCIYDFTVGKKISFNLAKNTNLVKTSGRKYIYCVNGKDLPISLAAKNHLVEFEGAPLLDKSLKKISDISKTQYETNTNLEKGARLQEKIFEILPGSEVTPKFHLPCSETLKTKPSLTDNPTEVSFEKQENDKKIKETKIYDTKTDKDPVKVDIKDGEITVTSKVTTKIQKSLVKNTTQEGESFYDNRPLPIFDQSKYTPNRNKPDNSYSSYQQLILTDTNNTNIGTSFAKPIEPSFDKKTSLDLKGRKPSLESKERKFIVNNEEVADNSTALARGLIRIDWDEGIIINNFTNEHMSAFVAFNQGFIDSHIYSLILNHLEKKSKLTYTADLTLNDALASGRLIIPFGVIRHLNEKFSVEEMIRRKYLDCEKSVVLNPSNMKPLFLSEAIDKKIFDVNNCTFADLKKNKIYSLQEAVNKNFIPINDLEKFSEICQNRKQRKEQKLNRSNKQFLFFDALDQGMMNPKTGTLIDPQTRRNVTLSEAIDNGLIIPPETDVIDRVEGIGFQEALDRGLIDIKNNTFTDHISGVLMPLDAAIRRGYVLIPEGGVELKIIEEQDSQIKKKTENLKMTRNLGFDDLPLDFSDAILCGIYDENSCVFINPFNNTNCDLATCISQGIIDMNSKVINPLDGSFIPLSNAIQEGFIDPDTAKYIDPQSLDLIDITEAIDLGLLQLNGCPLWTGTSGKMFPKINIESVMDVDLHQWVSLSDAERNKIIDMQERTFTNSRSKEVMSIYDALKRGFIKTTDVSNSKRQLRELFLISVYDGLNDVDVTPEDAANLGIINMKDGIYVDRRNNEMLSLSEAYRAGLITASEDIESLPEKLMAGIKDYEIDFVFDPKTSKKMFLDEAIYNNLIDPSRCIYIDTSTGEEMSIKEAIECGYIFSKNKELNSSAKFLSDMKSSMIKSVLDPRTGEEIPIADAVRHQIVDKSKNTYLNLLTNKYMPLQKALKEGLVLIDTVDAVVKKRALVKVGDQFTTKLFSLKTVKDVRSGKEYDPIDAERRGLINKIRGIYMDPLSGDYMTIRDAINKGLVTASEVTEPDYDELYKQANTYAVIEAEKDSYLNDISCVLDLKTGEEVTVMEAIRRGIINIKNDSYINTKTGQEMRITEALSKGLMKTSRKKKKVPTATLR